MLQPRFLGDVTTLRSPYGRSRPTVVCLSVCLSSVTLFRATHKDELFASIFAPSKSRRNGTVCTELRDFIPSTSRVLSRVDSPPHPLVNSSFPSSPLSSSITLSLQAHNLTSQQILSILDFFYLLTGFLRDNGTGLDLSRSSVYF